MDEAKPEGSLDAYEDAIIAGFRDYRVIDSAVARLQRRGFHVEELGMRFVREKGHMIYMLESPAVQNVTRILVTTGAHGDEAECAYGLLSFLETFKPQNEQLAVIPVTNPRAFVAGKTGIKYDFNRAFPEDASVDVDIAGDVPEAVKIVCKALRGRRFDVHFDLHSDFEGKGFFVYERLAEKTKQAKSLARRLVERLDEEGFRHNEEKSVSTRLIGNQRNYSGVVPSYRKEQTFEAYMAARGVPFCYTLEFPEAALVERPDLQLKLVVRALEMAVEESRRVFYPARIRKILGYSETTK
ncbi:MAG: succinylglutamate desuccinylase/aspartoacylase family protein [Candidatus Aenigmarchaeota archaeon]|nr:succinylglutamate desuccinylase/aspartoacylase family protein [Candidatus Aenigmarchaeota archaeon]